MLMECSATTIVQTKVNKIMKIARYSCMCFVFVIIGFYLTNCEQKQQSLTIALYDKQLSTIQYYITGKWMLHYSYGGILAHKIKDTHNSYLHLSPNHIIAGNDSLGVVVDTSIIWVRVKLAGNDSTYLLSYYWRGYIFPEHFIVNQIKNDTLIISDYGSDGFKYYYTKY